MQSKADAFEYADQVLERWYPTVEEGSNKGIVVLVTSQKEGAITGGPEFVKAVGDNVLDATVSENLPGNCTPPSSFIMLFPKASKQEIPPGNDMVRKHNRVRLVVLPFKDVDIVQAIVFIT